MKLKNRIKKLALALSIAALIVWAALGTGTSLAWFTDETPEIKNIFHTAEFDLDVSYRYDGVNYKSIEGETDIFDKEALYEPGYVQVIYLKIENKGNVPFDFYTAVTVYDYVPAINYFGQSFNLQDYLMFGVVTAESEADLDRELTDREAAVAKADKPLNNYDTEKASLDAGEEAYIALIVRMPEEVDNVANYRSAQPPKVELGIIVNATQQEIS